MTASCQSLQTHIHAVRRKNQTPKAFRGVRGAVRLERSIDVGDFRLRLRNIYFKVSSSLLLEPDALSLTDVFAVFALPLAPHGDSIPRQVNRVAIDAADPCDTDSV